MPSTIQLKRSGVPGKVPDGLLPGELALNYNDGIIYFKVIQNGVEAIFQLAAVPVASGGTTGGDYGLISNPATNTLDFGWIIDAATASIDHGQLFDTAPLRPDLGLVTTQPFMTTDLGSISEPPTSTIEYGAL